MTLLRCPVCEHPGGEIILTLQAVPLFSNVLHAKRRQALDAECASIQLGCCPKCGFIFNAVFQPDKMHYGAEYENDLSVSSHFCRYATDVAIELVQRYDLNGKDIIDIGCGNGHFLKLICDVGENRGVGFDPSHDPQRASVDRRHGTVSIVADTYSPQYRDRRADMVCCRHVLEHIHDPLAFLQELYATVRLWDDCLLFFEVPNAEHTFFRGAIWDILYEHCNYFTRQSLWALFQEAGFHPLRVDERYDGQFLTIEARCTARVEGESPEVDLPKTAPELVDFQNGFQDTVDSWQERVTTWIERRRKVVAWGAGAKGATFLNVLGLSCDIVEHIVDINPRKQGRFIPGTGQEIIPPASLAQLQPGVVIVINPSYLNEIRRSAQKYATGAEFISASALHPPSRSVGASAGITAESNMTPVPERDDEYCSQ